MAEQKPSGMKQTSDGKIGFLFGVGHGHYAQFLNFQECCPPEDAGRIEWAALPTDASGDFWANLPGMPAGLRYRRHQLWHVQEAIKRRQDWDALFFAAMQIRFLPYLRRYRSYLYTDFAPSGKRELAPWYDSSQRGPRVAQALKHTLETQMLRACRGIFTMSRWAADGLIADYGLDPSRLHVVLPGANLHHWSFVDRSERGSRPVQILFVGGEFARKGGPLLLDWAKGTAQRGWELDIVTWPGAAPEEASRLPGVRVHCGLKANTPELMRLYEDADILCLPTLADGSSIASLEAMASGLPVLAGAVGGIPELIKDGETGFLLQRGDAKDLAVKLEALIADTGLRQRIGVAARTSCETYFNVTRQMKEILAVMDRDHPKQTQKMK